MAPRTAGPSCPHGLKAHSAPPDRPPKHQQYIAHITVVSKHLTSLLCPDGRTITKKPGRQFTRIYAGHSRTRAGRLNPAEVVRALTAPVCRAQLAPAMPGPAWSPRQREPLSKNSGKHSANLPGPGLWPTARGNLMMLNQSHYHGVSVLPECVGVGSLVQMREETV